MSDCLVPRLYSLNNFNWPTSKILMSVPFSETVARRLPSCEMLSQFSGVLCAFRTEDVQDVPILSTFTTSAVPAFVPRHPKTAVAPFPLRHPRPPGLGSVEMLMSPERLLNWYRWT